jgi:uncharacterized protein (TIGR02996 family)
MTLHDAFLRDLFEHPDDDLPRLIFADWLDDDGQADRAEFIRAQVRLARLQAYADDEVRALQARCDELLARHDEEWAGPVVSDVANGWQFERGFLTGLTIEARALAANVHELFAVGPLRRLKLLDAGEHLGEVVWLPSMAQIVSLDLCSCRIGDAGMELLAMSRFLSSLSDLCLRRNDIGPDGARALAGSSTLRHLRRLDLSWNHLGEPGAEALARWPGLDALERLDVSRNTPPCSWVTLRRLGKRAIFF